MPIDVAAFGWHATIFLGRGFFLFAGLAMVASAAIVKIVYGAGWLSH